MWSPLKCLNSLFMHRSALCATIEVIQSLYPVFLSFLSTFYGFSVQKSTLCSGCCLCHASDAVNKVTVVHGYICRDFLLSHAWINEDR